MDDNGDVNRGLPSDFPSDPVIHHHYFAWAVLVVLVIALAWLIGFLYQESHRRVGMSFGEAIEMRVRRVLKAIRAAASARIEDQLPKAEAVKQAVSDNFGASMALSKALNGSFKPLLTALDGQKDETVAGNGMLMPGGQMTGGTIINIAVNQGAEVGPVTAGQAGGTQVAATPGLAGVPGGDGMMSATEKSHAVWIAIQAMFNYWKNRASVVMAFRSAQEQLLRSPRWDPPRDLNPLNAIVRKDH